MVFSAEFQAEGCEIQQTMNSNSWDEDNIINVIFNETSNVLVIFQMMFYLADSNSDF